MRTLLSICFLLGSLAGPVLPQDQAKPSEATSPGTVTSERRSRVRLGGIIVGAGYSRYRYPYYYGYPFGFYPPYFSAAGYWPVSSLYLPMYYPGFYPPFYSLTPGENMGEIKLRALPRDAEVLLDGAYAGKADDLKSFWLKPGAYNLEVRAQNRAPFSRRIYVLSGKTLKIEAELNPQEVRP